MTIEEIQYEAQGIMQEWGSNDSAPYVEFVEKLASMELPESPSNLDEAAEAFAHNYDMGTCDGYAQECFKAGAEWMEAKIEKDSELTWEDMLEIVKINMTLFDGFSRQKDVKNHFEEVLRRFKEYKQKGE